MTAPSAGAGPNSAIHQAPHTSPAGAEPHRPHPSPNDVSSNQYSSQSFVGRHELGQRLTFQLYHPGDGRPTSALELHQDVNFNFIEDREEVGSDDGFSDSSDASSESDTDSTRTEVKGSERAAEATPADPSPSALKALRQRDFHLEWSGVAPPPGVPPGSSQLSAATLFQSSPSGLLKVMLEILDEYLETHPRHRPSAELHDWIIPGQHGSAMPITEEDTELAFTRDFKIQHLDLANRLLRFCGKAVKWYAKSHQPDISRDARYPWPVPLSGHLELSGITRVNPNDPLLEHAKHATPDLTLRWQKGRPEGNLAVGDINPWLRPEAAVRWSLPCMDPVGAQRQATDPTATTAASSSRSSVLPRRHDASRTLRHGYEVGTQDQMLTLQVVTQLVLHNCACGVIVGDSGRILVCYELRQTPGTSGGRCALCISKRAVFPYMPNQRSKGPVAHAASINDNSKRLWSQHLAHLDLTAIPGPVMGMLEWALHGFDIGERQCHQPMPVDQQILSEKASGPNEQGGPGSSGQGAGRWQRMRSAGVADIVAHVRKTPANIAEARALVTPKTPQHSIASIIPDPMALSGAEVPVSRVRLRVSLIDWSAAVVDADEYLKASELDELREILEELQAMVGPRVKAAKPR